MTLCIAAACKHGNDPAIVFCSDTRSSSNAGWWGETINSDNADKSRTVEDYSACVSGDPTKADELLALFIGPARNFSRQSPSADSDLYISQFFEGLRTACRLRVKAIKDHHIAMHTPFEDVEEFLQKGTATIPPEKYNEIWNELRNLNLGCEILLGCFHEEAIIVKVGMDGEVHWVNEYDAIGAGCSDALAFLGQNEYDESEIQSHDCLLRLTEALIFTANINPKVSFTRRYEVFIEDKGSFDISKKFSDMLEKKYRLLKPVKLTNIGDFLEKVGEGVSSKGEQENTQQTDAGNEQPSGSGSSSAESGDSAPTGRVPGDGSQQPQASGAEEKI